MPGTYVNGQQYTRMEMARDELLRQIMGGDLVGFDGALQEAMHELAITSYSLAADLERLEQALRENHYTPTYCACAIGAPMQCCRGVPYFFSRDDLYGVWAEGGGDYYTTFIPDDDAEEYDRLEEDAGDVFLCDNDGDIDLLKEAQLYMKMQNTEMELQATEKVLGKW